MIALSSALDPKLVIMDEPTTALDVVTQREILGELAELRARFGFAMIFITHDLSLLVELADEIAVMYAGRLVERAGARALYDAPRHPYTLGLLNSFPPMHGERKELTGIPGLTTGPLGSAERLCFSSPVPIRDGALPQRNPALGDARRRGSVRGVLAARGERGASVPVELRRATPSALERGGSPT